MRGLLMACLTSVVLGAAPSPTVIAVREWRQTRERQIVAELMQLVSLPNIASNKADIIKNADALTGMFEKRGFTVALIQTPGSPVLLARKDAANTPAMMANAAAVRGDLAIIVDSPRHPSGLPTVFYGSRGVTGAEITIYGATGDLHSGNYGNFVPDPAMALTKLIASMKDDAGNVAIKGFYDAWCL